jgi:hypothetical protein
MDRKWLTVKMANGQTQSVSLDEDGNGSLKFPVPTAIVEITVSDQPEHPLADAFQQALGPRSPK